MHAILLAAGQGRRLGINEPKCLIEVAGKSLLERHLQRLEATGHKSVTVVVGHKHERIEAALQVIESSGQLGDLEVRTCYNDRFTHGSIVSLQCAIDALCHTGGLWMDADVIYGTALLQKLALSKHHNCVLLDGRSSEQGEEMMLAVKQNRVQKIARRVGSEWDLVGESIGFFKVDAAGAQAMKTVLDIEIAAGRLDQEHEDALNIVLKDTAFGFERADAFAWTEIDFPEDLEKARRLCPDIDS